jgi:hypothetical protein
VMLSVYCISTIEKALWVKQGLLTHVACPGIQEYHRPFWDCYSLVDDVFYCRSGES